MMGMIIMKKFNLFLSIVSLFVIFSLTAHCDDLPLRYDWSDVEAEAYDAYFEDSTFWYVEEVDAVIWLPNLFIPVELTEEDRAEDIIACFSSDSGDGFVLLSYSELPNANLDLLYNALKLQNSSTEMILVNGIPAIYQKDIENNATSLLFHTREGKIFMVLYFASPESDYSSAFDFSLPSIQPRSNLEESPSTPTVVQNPVSSLIVK